IECCLRRLRAAVDIQHNTISAEAGHVLWSFISDEKFDASINRRNCVTLDGDCAHFGLCLHINTRATHPPTHHQDRDNGFPEKLTHDCALHDLVYLIKAIASPHPDECKCSPEHMPVQDMEVDLVKFPEASTEIDHTPLGVGYWPERTSRD